MRGGLRDIYEIPGCPVTGHEKRLLAITTDRVPALGAVPQGIPGLGKVRNRFSAFWFDQIEHICPHHVFNSDQAACASTISAKHREANDLIGRCLLVQPARVFQVSCVVRGYLAGSAWESYRKHGTVCGIRIKPGFKEAEELPRPIFTPSAKAADDREKPITFDQLVQRVGGCAAEELREKSLELYSEAARLARRAGIIIIADARFEFGHCGNQIILIGGPLTPDSARFWRADEYNPGGPQPSFDSPLKRWFSSNSRKGKPPVIPLPDEVIEEIRQRYVGAFEALSGRQWPPEF